jgi:hypothetical protein
MKNMNAKRWPVKPLLIACIACCCTFAAKSQTVVNAPVAKKAVAKAPLVGKTPVALIDTFFKKYKNDGTNTAIDYLFGTNKLFTNEAQIALLKAKLDSLQKTVGQYLAKELIAEKNTSPSLVFYSYLVKFTNQPIRFTFMFYKPQNDWELYRFKYDDQMDAEMEEAGKINNKKP